jgi:hypothetical protein
LKSNLKKEIEIGNLKLIGFENRFGKYILQQFFKPNEEMLLHPFLKRGKFLTKSSGQFKNKINFERQCDNSGESLLDDEIII